MTAPVVLPNIRKLFIPDPGHTIFEADLKGADAQVVAWEAGDDDLKAAFRAGVDIHVKNASDMMGDQFTSLAPGSAPWRTLRKQNKVGVHLTNYGGSARTLAITQRWKIVDAERWQQRWFSLHPGIKEWHKKIEHDLHRTRTVYNKYGYRIIYFDRISGLLPEALAWIPQSSVALACFKGALRLNREVPWAQILLQVHDSLVFQVPHHRDEEYDTLLSVLNVPIPYDDPLNIPWTLKRSRVSWGDCAVPEELKAG